MVGICLADGAAERGVVAFGDELKEGALYRVGNFTKWHRTVLVRQTDLFAANAAHFFCFANAVRREQIRLFFFAFPRLCVTSLLHETLQRLSGAVFGRQGGDGVEEGLVRGAPAQFVVEKVADEPRVVRMRGAALPGQLFALLRESRMEDVGESCAGGVFVGGNPAVGVIAGAEARGEVEVIGAVRVGEAPIPDFGAGPDGDEVESPGGETGVGVLRPCDGGRELLLHRLSVWGGLDFLAIHPDPRAPIDARENDRAAERIDHPVQSIDGLDVEESRRLSANARLHAHGAIGRDRRRRELPRGVGDVGRKRLLSRRVGRRRHPGGRNRNCRHESQPAFLLHRRYRTMRTNAGGGA